VHRCEDGSIRIGVGMHATEERRALAAEGRLTIGITAGHRLQQQSGDDERMPPFAGNGFLRYIRPYAAVGFPSVIERCSPSLRTNRAPEGAWFSSRRRECSWARRVGQDVRAFFLHRRLCAGTEGELPR